MAVEKTEPAPSQATEIHFILDRSGSMDACRSDTIGGFNSFLRSQKELQNAGVCRFSLYVFDHEYLAVCQDIPVAEVAELTPATFVPRGNTALYDAIGRTICRVAAQPTAKTSQVIIVILTDGQENSSREFSQQRVRQLITEHDALENWSFVFLAANQDAILTAQSVGMASTAAMSFTQEPAKMARCYDNLSAAISRTRMSSAAA